MVKACVFYPTLRLYAYAGIPGLGGEPDLQNGVALLHWLFIFDLDSNLHLGCAYLASVSQKLRLCCCIPLFYDMGSTVLGSFWIQSLTWVPLIWLTAPKDKGSNTTAFVFLMQFCSSRALVLISSLTGLLGPKATCPGTIALLSGIQVSHF